MKRALIVSLILALLLSALSGSLLQTLANPEAFYAHPPPWVGLYQGCHPVENLVSPRNTTYYFDDVSLIILDKHGELYRSLTYFYILDGQADMRADDARVNIAPNKITSKLITPDYPWDPYYLYTLEFNVTLSSLSNGSHNLIIGVIEENPFYWKNPYISVFTPNIYFTVEKPAPKVTILSPLNKTYGSDLVLLNFKIGEEVSRVCYSVDGKANVTVGEDFLVPHFLSGHFSYVNGNLTLSGLSEGVHSLAVYAEDSGGRVGVDSCVFTVGSEVLKAESYPIIYVAATIIASVAAVSAGVLFYARKRKHRGLSQVKG